MGLLAETEPNRHWDLDLSGEPFTVHHLRAPVLGTHGDATVYGVSIKAHRLLRQRPRAVVLDGWESPAYLAIAWHARRLGIRVIASYRSTQKTHRHQGGLVAAVRRRFMTSASAVVTGGRDSTDAVKALGVPEQRIHTGFNTVDVETFAKVAAAEKCSIQTPRHVFLYVGQLIPRKNVDGLIRAFALVAGSSDLLSIVGSGKEEGALRHLARELGVHHQVHFLGHLSGDALLAAYSKAHTLVLASHEEVWGLVVNEALVAGLHVVVSDRCGVAADVNNMPAVWICSAAPSEVAAAMRKSRACWSGPVRNHPMVARSPQVLGSVFLNAVEGTSAIDPV